MKFALCIVGAGLPRPFRRVVIFSYKRKLQKLCDGRGNPAPTVLCSPTADKKIAGHSVDALQFFIFSRSLLLP